MKRRILSLLILLLTLSTLTCVKETNTNTTTARPSLANNTNNSAPPAQSSPQAKNANSNLNKVRAFPSPTPTPAVSTLLSNSSNRGVKSSDSASGGSGDDYYINSRGVRVRRPVRSSTAPAGATARCQDGTYSFSQSRRGTCSHHGGVAEWL